MPRKRKGPVRAKGCVPPDVMEKAVSFFRTTGKLRQSAAKFGIAWSTLRRYVLKTDSGAATCQFEPNYKNKQVFPESLEVELKDYIIQASKIHYGVTKKKVTEIAYKLAKSNGLKFPESWEKNQRAGEDWLKSFRKRWPEISLRKPEATSLARATAFNRTTVAEFNDNLKAVYQKIGKVTANQIYNLDETGLTTVHKPPNVLAGRGEKQVGQITSGERGVLVTICCFICANGSSLPPFMVFPRVHFKQHMLRGSPPGTVGAATKSGWMNSEVFLDVLQHFRDVSRCSIESPVVLIYDNHESHIGLEVWEFCRANGIHVVTLPPHTSAKLQPLDVAVYKSLKNYYNAACHDWMASHPGQTINIYHVAELFGKAYVKSVNPQNIIHGFAKTGIWPINSNQFRDDEFLSSFVTDRAEESPSHSALGTSQTTPASAEHVCQEPPGPSQVAPASAEHVSQGPPGPSLMVPASPNNVSPGPSQMTPASPKKYVSPKDLFPFPKAGKRTEKGKTRKRGRTLVLTSTPVKEELEEKQKLKNKKKPTACVRRVIFQSPKLAKKDEEESSCEDSSLCELGDSDSDSVALSTDEECKETPIKLDDNCVVKVFNKNNTDFRFYVAQVKSVGEEGFDVTFYKRGPKTLRFSLTDETGFVPKEHIVKKLKKRVESSTARFKGLFQFFDLPDLTIY